jgi:PIN domain nuclease of toxin-antitoxin system
VGSALTTVLLDTHVLVWWDSEPDRLSKRATAAVTAAEQLAVSAISWFELAWLARNERITTTIPMRSWLEELAEEVRTVGITPAIADTAVSLPSSFPGDPVDRLIYATAIEHGWQLITKDKRLRRHRHPRPLAVW